MNTQKRTFFFVLSLLVVSVLMAGAPVWAQTNTNPSGNPEVKYGVYDVSQTVEFGGKIVSHSGSDSIWSTFVNQNSGPRLVSESFEMHAPTHNGLLFDDMSLNSFGGFGGDPNNTGILKIQKGKYYTFRGNFRRDKSFFDYNLLANPMNPPATISNASVAFNQSPHMSSMTRKSQDYNLELFPVSRFKVRLGYVYENQSGWTFLSSHFGTEPDYTRPIRSTNTTYRAGFTYKLFEGTNVTFDHVMTHFKNDASSYDRNQLYMLNGRPIDMGVPFAGAPYNAPCAGVIVNGGASNSSSTATVNTACNGYYNYTQFFPQRSDIPTDSVGFTSTYKRLSQTAHAFYSGGELSVPKYSEYLDGLTTRTNLRIASTTGNMFNKRVASGFDYAATFTINNHLRVVDQFKWDASRIPSTYFFNQQNQVGVVGTGPATSAVSLLATPAVWNAANCPAPYTGANCPNHTSSSAADVINEYYYRFEGEDLKSNLISLEFDANRHFGGHVGFRYDAKKINLRANDAETLVYYPGATSATTAKTSSRNAACVGANVDAAGVCTVNSQGLFPGNDVFEPNTKSFIAGVWFRPSQALRVNFDTELAKTDHPWLVIAPKTFQLYRLKSTFKPNDKLAFAFFTNVMARNNDEATNFKSHNRSLGFDTSVNPVGKFGLDIAYQYSDVATDAYMCYWANPNVLGSAACAANPVSQYYQTTSFYRNDTHFGSMNVFFHPTARIRGAAGYAVNRSGGNALMTSQTMSLGPLDSIYHMPTASLEFDINKTLTFKSGWNYYGYEEGSYQVPGVTPQRDARGNVVSLTLKYKIGGAR